MVYVIVTSTYNLLFDPFIYGVL